MTWNKLFVVKHTTNLGSSLLHAVGDLILPFLAFICPGSGSACCTLVCGFQHGSAPTVRFGDGDCRSVPPLKAKAKGSKLRRWISVTQWICGWSMRVYKKQTSFALNKFLKQHNREESNGEFSASHWGTETEGKPYLI